MPTLVALSATETRLLQRLRGQPLDALSTDGWAVYLRSGTRLIAFLPEEVDGPDEVLLPDADVVRIRVEERPTAARSNPMTELSAGLGRIRHLAVMTTLVAFRLPGPAAAPEENEPPRFFHPDDPATGADERPQTLAWSLVDVGVAVEADRGWTVIASDGWRFGVFAALANATEARLAGLTGKVRLEPLFTASAQPA